MYIRDYEVIGQLLITSQFGGLYPQPLYAKLAVHPPGCPVRNPNFRWPNICKAINKFLRTGRYVIRGLTSSAGCRCGYYPNSKALRKE
jgi:hypothetical protein